MLRPKLTLVVYQNGICPVPERERTGERIPMMRRQESSTGIYHVTARGINKEHIFNQFRERYYFKKILRKHLQKYDVNIYAYCIMSNHIHLIIHSELRTLSLFMSRVLAEYAQYYNFKHGRNGHVFQNRFGSERIENVGYFWNCMRYIHMNPVKASIVSDVWSYKFSSVREYQRREADIIHESSFAIWETRFQDIDDFFDFHQQRDGHIYMDIVDDVELQMQIAATTILNIMRTDGKVEKAVEILEDKILRDKYLASLRKSLNISKKRAEKLYKSIKDSIMIK